MFNYKIRDFDELSNRISSRLINSLSMWELKHMSRVYKITILVKNGYYEKFFEAFITNITGITPPVLFFETD